MPCKETKWEDLHISIREQLVRCLFSGILVGFFPMFREEEIMNANFKCFIFLF